MTVIELGDFGERRELLNMLDEARKRILKGNISGFILCVRDETGSEEVLYGGEYERNPRLTLMASVEMSRRLNKL